MLSLKLFLVKTWNIKHGHIRKLDLESTYFVDLHGIVIHDADRIGAVISEGDILNLFQGDKTNTTVPQSKLSGTLAASGKETLRREYERKQEEYMRELMRPKPKINWELKKRVYKEHKSTPFELAGIGATDRMFESFKHNGLGLNDVDSQGRTALLIAATFDHYDTCHELLEAGANPDILDYEGWTALAAVCRYGHVSILILLLDNGADRSLRATGGPWHMEHLVVHGKACQDNVKRDQVLSILRGHRIAGSWLEIIDSHWLSIGGRPDYDEMINNTSEFLRKYGEKLEKEEKEEFEAMEEAKRNGMEYKKESTEKNSSLDLIGPWNLPLKSKDRENNEAVLFHIFQQMLQSTNKNKSRHFIQQIPMDSDLLLSPEELKKKKKKVVAVEELTTGQSSNYFDTAACVAINAAKFKYPWYQPSLRRISKFSSIISSSSSSSATKIEKHLVISRYKEDLSWIVKWKSHLQIDKIFIYNKNEDEGELKVFLNLYGNNPDLFIMQLPNVGRESHSWLHHMTRKDVTFGHVNIFVQGTPEVSLSTLENDLKRHKRVQYISLYDDTQDQEKCTCYPFCFQYDIQESHVKVMHEFCKIYDSINIYGPSCVEYTSSLRGEFVLSDERIREFLSSPSYRNLKIKTRVLDALSNSSDPIEGHYLERLWNLLFNHADWDRSYFCNMFYS